MRYLSALFIFLACLPVHGQAIFFGQNFNTATAASAPTFSPAAGAVANPTTVTASTSTPGCGSYIYFDTNSTPTTNQTTYSVTTAVTLYAYVHGCPGYTDSTISSASYTIAVSISAVGTPACGHGSSGGATSAAVTYTPHATTDTLVVTMCLNSGTSSGVGVVDSGTYNTYTSLISENGNSTQAYVFGVLSNNRSGSMTITGSWTTGADGLICVSEYSGPVAFGNTGTNTAATSGSSPYPYTNSVTTQDANNWQVSSICPHNASSSTYTATNGTIRANGTTTGWGALTDNSSATTGSLTTNGTFTAGASSGSYAAAGIELRTQ